MSGDEQLSSGLKTSKRACLLYDPLKTAQQDQDASRSPWKPAFPMLTVFGFFCHHTLKVHAGSSIQGTQLQLL